jgi:beta-galactosidase
MFKRLLTRIMALFLLASLFLFCFWRDVPVRPVYSDWPVTQINRISQDLGGMWDSYSSLRQAAAAESRQTQGDREKTLNILRTDSVLIPSDQEFKVAVKRFKVTGKWGFNTAQLVLGGVYGKARIFLNGIDEVHYIGEVEGVGGTYQVDIAPTRFDFNQENILYLELAEGSLAQKKLGGWLWPEKGRITGQVSLAAVTETTIDFTQTTVAYDAAKENLLVNTVLTHHLTSEQGPWVLSAVVKDNNQKVADCLLPLNADGEAGQKVALTLKLPGPKLWSPGSPSLYELDLMLTNSRGDYDGIQFPVGIKTNTETNGKWRLNNQDFHVQGEMITAQQAYSFKNQQALENYLRELKAKGLNTVYFMGFFPDEGWLFCADRLGMGVWLEMPAAFVPAGQLPPARDLDELFAIAQRHPSVLALTAGKELEASPAAATYLQEVKNLVPGYPVYHLRTFPTPGPQNPGDVLLDSGGLKGAWGNLDFNRSLPAEGVSAASLSWGQEKTAAIIWFLWLLVLSFQNWRTVKWNYAEIFADHPKRALRMAFFWGTAGLICRMATLGAVLISLLFQIPLALLARFSYDIHFLVVLRSQPPLLLWLLLSLLLVLFKIFATGLAAPSFPQQPGVLGLCCWLERRHNWSIWVGAAWVIAVFKPVWYLPLGVYLLFLFLSFPLRVRAVWKAGGKYRYFYLLPLTLAIGAIALIFSHWPDFTYLAKILVPQLLLFINTLF